MKNKKVLLLLIFAFGLLLGLASALYNRLGSEFKPEQLAVAQTQPAEENSTEPQKVQVPDFTVYDLEGNPVKLSDFQGQPVILNFWASWCGPCKAEMPDLEEAYLAHGSEIAFLVVNLTDGRNETVESASGYIAQQGYTFPVYYDTGLEAVYAYGINSIPMTYFIDGQGNVVADHLGMISADGLQQGVDALLSGN